MNANDTAIELPGPEPVPTVVSCFGRIALRADKLTITEAAGSR